MPRKTNTTINSRDYFRVTVTIGKTADGRLIRKRFRESVKTFFNYAVAEDYINEETPCVGIKVSRASPEWGMIPKGELAGVGSFADGELIPFPNKYLYKYCKIWYTCNG